MYEQFLPLISIFLIFLCSRERVVEVSKKIFSNLNGLLEFKEAPRKFETIIEHKQIVNMKHNISIKVVK